MTRDMYYPLYSQSIIACMLCLVIPSSLITGHAIDDSGIVTQTSCICIQFDFFQHPQTTLRLCHTHQTNPSARHRNSPRGRQRRSRRPYALAVQSTCTDVATPVHLDSRSITHVGTPWGTYHQTFFFFHFSGVPLWSLWRSLCGRDSTQTPVHVSSSCYGGSGSDTLRSRVYMRNLTWVFVRANGDTPV